MKFYLDTEFYEDGRTIELISIGIVAEDGRKYYAETPDAKKLSRMSEWLSINVAPNIGGIGRTRARWEIAKEIEEFVGELPEFWGYYADYDWVALCQLFGRMIDLPKHFPKYCLDLKQLAMMCGNPTLPRQACKKHNALTDAIWNKEVHEFLLEKMKSN